MWKNWLKQCLGFVLVYDITNKNSLEDVFKWREQILESKEIGPEDLPAVLIGNDVRSAYQWHLLTIFPILV